jgi:hypothetical protein
VHHLIDQLASIDRNRRSGRIAAQAQRHFL